ncbi:MAG TPA: hypothetical protein VMT70_11380 [Vicinamibacteria bacterium]|nr:hypothetical protein [Vicinamibacteria bacterium]
MIAATAAQLRWLRPLAAQMVGALSPVLAAAAALGLPAFAAGLVGWMTPLLRPGTSRTSRV